MTMQLYQAYIDRRRDKNWLRVLRYTEPLPHGKAAREGSELINFAGNDYLGLSRHPALIARMKAYAERYGAGATASRLIVGNHPLYDALEQKLAKAKGTEAALILNSGYQANLTVLAALADSEALGKPVTLIADRLIHNSLIQGARLSGAKLIRFHHNDYAHLESLLHRQKESGTHLIIITESVFGMDGDCADLARLTSLAQQYGAMLYVDEAHATGLFGASGFGLCADHPGRIDLVMGTFGKALGSFGAYVACSKILRDYLIQHCGGLIYSTALPPPVLGAIEAALELVPQLGHERLLLQHQAARLRDSLRGQGWNTGNSTTQIIPVILGDEEQATRFAEALRLQAILAPAIRPPTVPRGTSRIRLSLSAAHSAADIDRLIHAFARLQEKTAA